MSSVSLVKRVMFIPLSIEQNSSLMASLNSAITASAYSDANGVWATWTYVNTEDDTQQYHKVEWLLTSTNDATFTGTTLPALLGTPALTKIMTYGEPVTASY